MSYNGLQGQILCLGSELHEHRCLEAAKEVVITDANPKPEQLQEWLKGQGEELTKVNLTEDGKKLIPIYINASLSADLRKTLLDQSKEYKDIFAWTYAKISRLDPQLFTHQFNIK